MYNRMQRWGIRPIDLLVTLRGYRMMWGDELRRAFRRDVA